MDILFNVIMSVLTERPISTCAAGTVGSATVQARAAKMSVTLRRKLRRRLWAVHLGAWLRCFLPRTL